MSRLSREIFATAFYAKVSVVPRDDGNSRIQAIVRAECRCPLLAASSCEVSNKVNVSLASIWRNLHSLEHLLAWVDCNTT